MYPIFAVYAPKSYHCTGDSRIVNRTQTAPLFFDGRTDVCQTDFNCIDSTAVNHTTNGRKGRALLLIILDNLSSLI